MNVNMRHVCSSIVLVLLVKLCSSDEACEKTGPCTCKGASGNIDLSAIAKADGTPQYSDQPDGSGQWYFSYNPCNAFSEGSGGCDGVAACQTDQMGSYFNLGTQDSAAFSLDANQKLQIEYTATTDTQRISYVSLVCDPNTESQITVTGENPPGSATYYFVLTSKHCCPSTGPGPNPTEGPGGPGGGIGVGSVLVIVFFGLLFVYAVFGTVFQAFVRKASGREMVPNYGLWSSVPGLIKDGFVFTFTCGRRSGYSKA